MADLAEGTPMLRLHRFLPRTRVEGPGERACLWVQGCPIHCPGCTVPWTWSETGGTLVPVAELARTILDGPPVEGVTFLGGEPFAQAGPLAALARELRPAGLSILTFTGYVLDEIQASGREDWLALVAASDLLIDGPFLENQLDLSRPWVGSRNQRYHFLTDRYRHLETELTAIPNRLEIRIGAAGQILINGMATSADLRSLVGSLGLPLS